MTLIHHAPPITEHSYLSPSISILPTPEALYCTLCPPSCNATTPCISIHCHQTNTSSPSSLLPHCSSSPSHVHLRKDAEICYKMGHLRKGVVTCKCRENLVLARFAGGVQGFLESVRGKGLGERGKTFQLCQFCSRFWLDLYSWESSLSYGYLELHFISIDKLGRYGNLCRIL